MSNSPRPRTWPFALAVAGLVVVLRLLVAGNRRLPIIFADELGYLGNARYLAGGRMPDLSFTRLYHAGYSLLLAPAFAMSSTPAGAYRGVIVINALLGGLLFLILRRLAQAWIGARHASSLAFLASLYPALIVTASLALAENGFVVAVAASCLAVTVSARAPTSAAALAVAGAAAASYAVHPRGLVVLAAALVWLAVATAAGRLTRAAFGCATLLAIVIVASVMLLNRRLGAVAGSINPPTSEILRPLSSWAGWRTTGCALVGQLWYLTLSTLGLVVVGVVAVVRRVARACERDGWRGVVGSDAGAYAFLIVAAGGSALLAALQMASDTTIERASLAHWIYGRYDEAWVAPLFVIGAAHARGWRPRFAVAVAAAIGAGAVAVAVIRGSDAFARTQLMHGGEGVFSIMPWGLVCGRLSFVAAVMIAIMLAALFIASRRRALAGIGLGALFLATSAIDRATFIGNGERALAQHTALAADARLQSATAVAFDVAGVDRAWTFAYEFLLPRARLIAFDHWRCQLPAAALAVAPADSDPFGSGGPALATSGDGSLAIFAGAPGRRDADCAPGGYRPAAGFYPLEWWGTSGVRWTDGDATANVARTDGRRLTIAVAATTPSGTPLEVRVNGRTRLSGRLPAGPWHGDVALDSRDDGVPLIVELISRAFVPRNVSPPSSDGRRLGIALLAIERR